MPIITNPPNFQNKSGLQLGPIDTIVNVQWPSGFFIVVSSKAIYQDPSLGMPLRTGTLSLTPEGIEVGGEIIAQRNIHEPLTIDTQQRSRFIGVVKFNRSPPKVTQSTSALFKLTLAGADSVSSPGSPAVVGAFCGETCTTFSETYNLVAIPFAEGNFKFVATVHWTTSTPAGTSSVEWTYDVAGVGLAEAQRRDGTTYGPFSECSSTIWYTDADGLYHNTQDSCDDLPTPGDPYSKTFFEGFTEITTELYRKQGYTVAGTAGWTYISTIDDILIPNERADGHYKAKSSINKRYIGLSGPDFVETFEDIPNGIYQYKLGKLSFLNLPPSDPPKIFQQTVVWPVTLTSQKYTFEVTTTKPTFGIHTMTPFDKKTTPIPVGTTPPSNQNFT